MDVFPPKKKTGRAQMEIQVNSPNKIAGSSSGILKTSTKNNFEPARCPRPVNFPVTEPMPSPKPRNRGRQIHLRLGKIIDSTFQGLPGFYSVLWRGAASAGSRPWPAPRHKAPTEQGRACAPLTGVKLSPVLSPDYLPHSVFTAHYPLPLPLPCLLSSPSSDSFLSRLLLRKSLSPPLNKKKKKKNNNRRRPAGVCPLYPLRFTPLASLLLRLNPPPHPSLIPFFFLGGGHQTRPSRNAVPRPLNRPAVKVPRLPIMLFSPLRRDNESLGNPKSPEF